jgi:type II secretory pathway predicted ATPase ExeA
LDTFCTYAQHFGLSGHPFSTTSDPAFFFESRGHRQAYEHLRHALLAGECLMVATGDTGAGKTMLLRRLLAGLDPDGIATALPEGTAELDARGLLLEILASFRTPVFGQSLEELRATLDSCLKALDSIGRKALVVVDEAQRLLPDAIEELIRFATPQWTDDLPLQVLLVGEPALRMNLPNLAQIEKRPTFLFCDVGRLSRAETRSYIEHRLRHVHWDHSPSFSDSAHERIYWAAEGVPQWVNQLCHRLLMAASRQQLSSISPELVEEAIAELREESDTAPAPDTPTAADHIAPAATGFATPEPGANATAAPAEAPIDEVLSMPAPPEKRTFAFMSELRTLGPRISDLALHFRDLAPRIRDLAPRIRDLAPRIRDLAPQIRSLAPRIRSLAPRIRSLAPRIRSFAPQIRNLAPRIRNLAPRIRRAAPKIGDAVVRYGWLTLPVVVVAGFVGAPAQKSVVSSLLADPPRAGFGSSTADPPRASIGSSTSDASRASFGGSTSSGPANEPRITRIGDPAALARKLAGQTAGGQPPAASIVGNLPQDAMLAAQLNEISARRAREEAARSASRRAAAVAVRRAAERPTPVPTTEPQRAVPATARHEASRSVRPPAKPAKSPDAQRTSPRQPAPRTRQP